MLNNAFSFLKTRPLYAILVLGIISFVTFIVKHPGEAVNGVFQSDALGYYQYLPGLFIDLDLKHLPWSAYLDNGNTLNIFHVGVAILELPFFLIAHGLTWIFGFKQDGYSIIYVYTIAFGTMCYLMLGLWFLHKFLTSYFSSSNALITILILYGGTNLYYYSAVEVGMSHVYSFFLFATFLYGTDRFFRSPDFKRSLLLGLLAGLIIVIRPNNGIVVLALIFYGLNSFKEIIPRMVWWLRNFRFVAIMLLGVFVFCFIQMSYWHHVSGKWIMFSYGQLGQQFFWTKAVMGKVLFSPQNGFLVYAPIMLFAIIGLIWGIIRKRQSFFLFLSIWALAWYIFASWWAWWFGGAYGHRAFIEYFVVMAPGLAYFISRIKNVKWILIPWTIVILFFLFISVRMTFTYHSPWDGPEWGWDDYKRELNRVFFIEEKK